MTNKRKLYKLNFIDKWMYYLRRKFRENKLQAFFILLLSVVLLVVAVSNFSMNLVSTSPPDGKPVLGNSIQMVSPGAIGSSTIKLNACGVLNKQMRQYILTSDINFDGDSCIKITSPNVVFDCRGYSVQGSSGGKAIEILASNVIVRNCDVGVNSLDVDSAAINAIDVNNIRILDSSTHGSYKGILFENVTDSIVRDFYSEGDYKSVDILSGSNYNNFENMKIINPEDIGVHVVYSHYNQFRNVEVSGALYGVYLRLTSSFNTFENLYSHDNELRAFVLTVAGQNNTFTDSVFANNEYGTKINGAANLKIINSIFSNSEVYHVFSASSANRGLTFINTQFINGDREPQYDIRFDNGDPENIVFENTLVKKYIFADGLTSMKYVEDEFGEVDFSGGVLEGSGSELSKDIDLSYNLAVIASDGNQGLDVPATITFFNMPGKFKNPVIFKDGVVCSECFPKADLNGKTVVFDTPGAGRYWIGENLTSVRD